MPFFGIMPSPSEREMCPQRFLVYGFPIPKEWFLYRYKIMKEAGIELYGYEKEYSLAMAMLKDMRRGM